MVPPVPPPSVLPPPASTPVVEAKPIFGLHKLRDASKMTLTQVDSAPHPEAEFVAEQTMHYKAFAAMAPYIAMHRGSTVVIHLPGELMVGLEDVESYSAPGSTSDGDDPKAFALRELALGCLRDVLLLKTLGVKPVLVAGCRPQIRSKLEAEGIQSLFVNGNRVCDKDTLRHCQSVAGHVRFQIESALSRGLSNTPTDLGTTSVVSGNFVKAIPFGIRNGIDFKYTGIVQKLTNIDRMNGLLDNNHILLLSHLGYSPSGDVFHCKSEDVAVVAAKELKASKLIFMHNGELLVDEMRKGTRGSIVHNMPISLAMEYEVKLREQLGQDNIDRLRSYNINPNLSPAVDKDRDQWVIQFLDYLQGAISACRSNVRRVHLVSRWIEGSIIAELYTREGSGIMISKDVYEGVRHARPEDIPAIMGLITPLAAQGILVTRPPEQVEAEVDTFIVFERDGAVYGCCQLVPYADDRFEGGAAEMCCVAVHPSHRGGTMGSALLSYCLRSCAVELGCTQLFVLTTRTAHWFTDRGFVEQLPHMLPPEKRAKYNYKRKPNIYFKHISSERVADEYDLRFHE